MGLLALWIWKIVKHGMGCDVFQLLEHILQSFPARCTTTFLDSILVFVLEFMQLGFFCPNVVEIDFIDKRFVLGFSESSPRYL